MWAMDTGYLNGRCGFTLPLAASPVEGQLSSGDPGDRMHDARVRVAEHHSSLMVAVTELLSPWVYDGRHRPFVAAAAGHPGPTATRPRRDERPLDLRRDERPFIGRYAPLRTTTGQVQASAWPLLPSANQRQPLIGRYAPLRTNACRRDPCGQRSVAIVTGLVTPRSDSSRSSPCSGRLPAASRTSLLTTISPGPARAPMRAATWTPCPW